MAPPESKDLLFVGATSSLGPDPFPYFVKGWEPDDSYHTILYLPTDIAGMAKLADAADLKSADPKGLWGFKSPSRHQI